MFRKVFLEQLIINPQSMLLMVLTVTNDADLHEVTHGGESGIKFARHISALVFPAKILIYLCKCSL